MMLPLALQNGNEGRLNAILARLGLSNSAAAPAATGGLAQFINPSLQMTPDQIAALNDQLMKNGVPGTVRPPGIGTQQDDGPVGLDATGTWAQKLGLQNPGGFAARANSGNLTPQDIATIGLYSSVAPQKDANGRVTNAVDFWSDAVTRAEHNETGNGGILGMKELSTGIPLVDNVASMLLGNSTGGQTGYNVATGNDVKQGVATDVAGLATGAGLSQALPSLGLSTVAPTTSDATLQSILAQNGLTNVADTGIVSGGPMPAGVTPGIGVDAINAAAPGAITKGLSDAELMSLGLGAGAAGGTVAGAATTPPSPTLTPLQQALATGGATAVGAEAVNPSSSDPAPALPPSAPKDIQLGPNTPTPTGGGYSVDPVTGNVIGSAAGKVATSAGGTKLGDILSGDVSPSDLLSNASVGDLSRVLGTGLATAGSIYADTQRADAQKEMYNTYLGLGAPSRARYEASFAPGFDVNSIPGFTNALDTTANTVLRKLSTSGNPFGNPGQLTEAMNYISGNLALPALNNYRNQNAATGGFGAFSTAAPGVGAAAIDSGSAAYSDLARGASDIFSPPTDLARLLRQYQSGGATSRGLT